MVDNLLLKLEIETLSDWHIGAGEGRYGIYDSLIVRNKNGLPFIPKTTMRGMLRDAAEHVAHALDAGDENKNWAKLVVGLFGSEPSRLAKSEFERADYEGPKQGCIHVGPAQLSNNLAACLAASNRNSELRQHLTFAKPGIKINSNTGMSETNMLRFDEVARKGMRLQCEVSIETEKSHEAFQAFFAAIAFVFDRVGGKRRRGQGVVKLSIEGGMIGKEARAHLTQAPIIQTIEDKLPNTAPSTKANGFKSIPFTIKLISPCLVGGEVRGNIIIGEDFIPGYALLPVISQLLSKEERNHIATGKLRVTSAYLSHNNKRSSPIPANWRIEKSGQSDNDKEVLNIDALPDDFDTKKQLKRLGYGYFAKSDAGNIIPFSPRMMTQTHNTIDDKVQRPTSDVGGVYVYEALAEGQDFHGFIEIADNISLTAMGRGKIRLGKAKSSGYGEAEITFHAEEAVAIPLNITERTLHVKFNSDTIIAGDNPVSLDAICQEIVRITGLNIDDIVMAGSHATLRSKSVSSWSTRWGFPRPDFTTIAAGSVATINFSKTCDLEKLAILKDGMGERRAEGFGEIEIIPASQQLGSLELFVSDVPANNSPIPSPTLDERDRKFAEILEDATLKAQLLEALQSKSQKIADALRMNPEPKNPSPPMSQLGGLRNVLLSAQEGELKTRLGEYFNSVENNPKRHDKWDKNIASWRKMFCQDNLWQTLAIEPALLSSSKESLKSRMNEYVVQATVMAVIKYHKREIEKIAAAPSQTTLEKI